MPYPYRKSTAAVKPTDAQLIAQLPLRYLDARFETPLRAARDGEYALIRATAMGDAKTYFIRRGLNTSRVNILADGGVYSSCVWFNRPFVKNKIKAGGVFLFFGRIKVLTNGARQILNPLFEDAEKAVKLRRLIPVYPKIAGIDAGRVAPSVAAALKRVAEIPSPVPPRLAAAAGLMPYDAAVRTLHNPVDTEGLYRARESVAAVALSRDLALFRLSRGAEQVRRAHPYNPDPDAFRAFLDGLPYKLTADQAAALDDVIRDFDSPYLMNRLLSGDVGSGKTAVALAAAYYCALSGGQAAIMAPTEVLARQHYNTALKMFGMMRVRVGLLTGGMKKEAADTVRFNLAHGEIDVIIGTHALFSEATAFRRLALIVADEQQRFGVAHRRALEQKGGENLPDRLNMSATPIPRTFSLALYGELSVSTLRSRPVRPADIETFVTGYGRLTDMYGFVAKQIEAGGAAYFVCPRIGKDDDEEDDDDGGGDILGGGYGENYKVDGERLNGCGSLNGENLDGANGGGSFNIETQNIDGGSIDGTAADDSDKDGGGYGGTNGGAPLKSAVELYAELKKSVLDGYGVGLLHGGMDDKQKNLALSRFAEGKTHTLVSTTVIEVGVDVAAASVIVVFNAERFGLAQLHQLRGRVGRAGQKSFCFLLTDKTDDNTRERLDYLKKTNDGFALAEYDFAARGAGDFIGSRQHGGSAFRGVKLDENLIVTAKTLAEGMIADPSARAALMTELAAADEIEKVTLN
jgi:ATP-dependent DNA helicase RecG